MEDKTTIKVVYDEVHNDWCVLVTYETADAYLVNIVSHHRSWEAATKSAMQMERV